MSEGLCLVLLQLVQLTPLGGLLFSGGKPRRRREWGKGWEEGRETVVGLQCIRKKKEKETRGGPLVTRASE